MNISSSLTETEDGVPHTRIPAIRWVHRTATGWARPSWDNATLVAVLAALGVLLRLRQYLFDRSLWLDEAMLTLNLIHRSPAQLLQPLDYHQGAPLAYLLLEKAVIGVTNSGELALRFVPFVSGILSVFLFVAVAKRLLSPGATAIAVGLFAVCGPLIYYSAEAKQYSSDVTVTLVLLLVASGLFRVQPGIIGTSAASLFAGLALWFSQPSAFVVAAIAATWLWVCVRDGDRSGGQRLAVFAVVTACSFALYYLVSLRGLIRDQPLLDYWSGSFAPFPPHSPAQFQWYLDSLFGMFSDPAGLTFTGIATVAGIMGIRELSRNQHWKALVLALPIAFALLGSAVHRYPFRGRLLLFAVPSMLLLIAAGLDAIRTKTRVTAVPLGALLIALLFVHPAIAAARAFARPTGVEESRPVIDYVQKHRLDGDVLYCYYSAEPALEYYGYEGLIRPIPTVLGVESRQNWTAYRDDVQKLRGIRVWIFFSHIYYAGGADEERLILEDLDRIGTRVDSQHAVGASVYLYDLTTR